MLLCSAHPLFMAINTECRENSEAHKQRQRRTKSEVVVPGDVHVQVKAIVVVRLGRTAVGWRGRATSSFKAHPYTHTSVTGGGGKDNSAAGATRLTELLLGRRAGNPQLTIKGSPSNTPMPGQKRKDPPRPQECRPRKERGTDITLASGRTGCTSRRP